MENDEEAAFKSKKEEEQNTRILNSIAKMYMTTCQATKKYKQQFNHTLYFTPTFFLRIFECFNKLLRERKKNV